MEGAVQVRPCPRATHPAPTFAWFGQTCAAMGWIITGWVRPHARQRAALGTTSRAEPRPSRRAVLVEDGWPAWAVLNMRRAMAVGILLKDCRPAGRTWSG